MILTEKFHEVLRHEGVVSLTTWANNEAHVTNTWNSYLVLKGDNILLPAAGMTSTAADLALNARIILTCGAREVEGFNGYQGTGFRVEGTAHFLTEGAEYEEMKARFPFLTRVLVVVPELCKQLL